MSTRQVRGIEFKMRKDRLIVGLLCIALGVGMILLGETDDTVAPAITVIVLGIVMVAIARKK